MALHHHAVVLHILAYLLLSSAMTPCSTFSPPSPPPPPTGPPPRISVTGQMSSVIPPPPSSLSSTLLLPQSPAPSPAMNDTRSLAACSCGKGSSRSLTAGLVVVSVLQLIVLLFAWYNHYITGRRMRRSGGRRGEENVDNGIELHTVDLEEQGHMIGDLEGETIVDNILGGVNTIFLIGELRQATGDFSQANELGRGGFGVVYKGELANGSMIL